MRYGAKLFEVKIVISRYVFGFKVKKIYVLGLCLLYKKARSISTKLQPRLINNRNLSKYSR